MALSGALRGTPPGSEGTGIPSSLFTCWFKPKPCAQAASCQKWKVRISRGVQKGTRAAAAQQRKPFLTLSLGALVFGKP